MTDLPIRSSRSAQVRATCDHPIIDGDGHWLEPVPIFCDFLRDVGGAEMVDRFRRFVHESIGSWYERSPEERYARRQTRPLAWGEAGNTVDRATAMLPKLLYERMDELGLDFALIYPSLGLFVGGIQDTELRRAFARAINNMSHELFEPYQDRLCAVAVVPTYTPDEGVEELEYVRTTLGMKAILINSNIRRPIPAIASKLDDPTQAPYYVDSLGLDSPYDYDPLWSRAVEHKVAVTTHGGSMGWPDRKSPTNFVYNHLGHFANSNHAIAKALFLGGVTRRFPTLNFAFLEGGVAWACSLYLDLIEHWEKRSRAAMLANLSPDLIDRDQFRVLFERYGDQQVRGRFAEIMASPSLLHPFKTFEEQVAQEPRETAMSFDDFEALGALDKETLGQLFRDRFYFGCEADDLATAWAFDKRFQFGLQPFFSSDIGHFDVTEMSGVVQEAYEMVEAGLLSDDDFKRFTFLNIATLHAGMNPRFFDGTAVEAAVSDLHIGGADGASDEASV